MRGWCEDCDDAVSVCGGGLSGCVGPHCEECGSMDVSYRRNRPFFCSASERRAVYVARTHCLVRDMETREVVAVARKRTKVEQAKYDAEREAEKRGAA